MQWISIQSAVLATALGIFSSFQVVEAPTPTQIAVAYEVPNSLDHWLKQLSICESQGKEHIKILDSNNRYSYGLLQFQMATWKQEGRKYLPWVEEKELENAIWDGHLQLLVAKKMLQADPTAWTNWKLCTRKLSVPVAE